MFFGVNFLSFDGQKNETKICPKDFWGKVQSCHISRKQKLNFPYLNHRHLYVTNIMWGWNFFYFSL